MTGKNKPSREWPIILEKAAVFQAIFDAVDSNPVVRIEKEGRRAS